MPSVCDGTGTFYGLDLSGNALSGTLPAQLGNLAGLRRLDLSDNALSGTLPAQLGNLAGLGYHSAISLLNLTNNQFAYPRSLAERDAYDKATRMCYGHQSARCLGIPPDSCTAFAGDVRPSIVNPNECVVCGDMTAGFIFIGVLTFFGVAAFAYFIFLVIRHPKAITRWVSSASILINHAQTASIIASMRIDWPHSFRAIASVFELNIFVLPSFSCLFSAGGSEADGYGYQSYVLINSCIVIALLLAPLLLKQIAVRFRRLAVADKAELVLSLIYSLVFTFAWSLELEHATHLLYSFAFCYKEYSQELEAPGKGDRCTNVRLEYTGLTPAQVGAEAGTAAMVLVLLLFLFIRSTSNVLAFKRGVDRGVWRYPTYPWVACCGKAKHIPPRRLKRQVAYLVGRFAPHAPRWQIVVWLRQFLLLLLIFTSNILFDLLKDYTFNYARHGVAALAIVVTLLFWFLHARTQPFAYRFQNALESCLYGATTLLIILAMAYTGLPDDPAAMRVSFEVLMAVVLLGSIVAGAIFSIRELRRMRCALASVDLSAVLSAADSKIDGSLADRLRDGSVRLLRCSWLSSPAADAFLGRDASTGALIMNRRQDLPPDAFVPCDEAGAMLVRGDRSILALSYGWLTALHPDPHGTTLASVRRFLLSDTAANEAGLFWDFASLPQRGPNGEEKTEEDQLKFKRGLEVMGSFYASVTGTSVIQQRDIIIPPGAATGVGAYNPTPYEGDCGRGWCIFEQGTAMTVLAHLAAAERQATEKGKALPERFRRAQASRAKVYDIAGEAPVVRECSLPPREVLDEACCAIEKARFTGKADRVMVPQMLAEFEWIFRSTFERALEDYATSGATIGRKEQEMVSREIELRLRQDNDDAQDTDGTEAV